MIRIPFVKAHGAKNDFLLTWADDVVPPRREELAVAICDRHTGVGADGWMLMDRGGGDPEHVAITLYNSDGSRSEISGNGTRCVAALAVELGLAADSVRILTGAGLKHLRVISAAPPAYTFEMDMGKPEYEAENIRRAVHTSGAVCDATILNVGNPQCAIFVADFDLDWRAIGAEVERHPLFPNRTNVSFIRIVDRNAIDVRFWERGAGETMSSGTGSTGAVFASMLRGQVESPVRVHTPAGTLDFRIEGESGFLIGPAELIGAGEYYSRI